MVDKHKESLPIQLIGYLITSLIIYLILNKFSLQIDLDNILQSASLGLVIYAIWEYIFNIWLWRTKLIRFILAIKTPYIHGRWKGYIKTSHDNFEKQFSIIIEIHQTFKSMNLTYYDEKSVSKGLINEFILEEGRIPKLFCIYRNEPITAGSEKLQIHYGTMILTVTKKTNIKGVYYNHYIQRETFGELFVEFENKKLECAF